MTYNLIVWDNPKDYLPFPQETKSLADKIDWKDYTFNVTGLPVHGAKYSVVNKSLYFEEWPDGKVSVRKEEFTGECIIGAVLNVKGEPSYFLTFKIIVLKGEIVEVLFESQKRFEVGEYDKYVTDYSGQVIKIVNRKVKWWYRWLYRPYAVIIRSLAMVTCWGLILMKEFVSWVASKITPL